MKQSNQENTVISETMCKLLYDIEEKRIELQQTTDVLETAFEYVGIPRSVESIIGVVWHRMEAICLSIEEIQKRIMFQEQQ